MMELQNEACGSPSAVVRDRSLGAFTTVVGTSVLVLGVVGLILASSEPTDVGGSSGSSRAILRCRENPIFSLAWSADGRRLAASTFGPVVRVWGIDDGSVALHDRGGDRPRFVMGWSADGREIVVGGLDILSETWDLASRESEGDPASVGPDEVSESVALLARSTGGKSLRIWGPTDRRLAMLPESGRGANSIAISPDGRFVASGGADGVLRLSDAATRAPLAKFEADPRGITSIAFSPDGSRVASAGGGPLRIWDRSSGRSLFLLGDGQTGSATLAFSPDGSRVAVACWDGRIQVWDLKPGAVPVTFRGHSGQVLTLAWSPDGKTLASGGYDSTVRLWGETNPIAGR